MRKLGMIVRVNVVLNRTIVDTGLRLNYKLRWNASTTDNLTKNGTMDGS